MTNEPFNNMKKFFATIRSKIPQVNPAYVMFTARVRCWTTQQLGIFNGLLRFDGLRQLKDKLPDFIPDPAVMSKAFLLT